MSNASIYLRLLVAKIYSNPSAIIRVPCILFSILELL